MYTSQDVNLCSVISVPPIVRADPRVVRRWASYQLDGTELSPVAGDQPGLHLIHGSPLGLGKLCCDGCRLVVWLYLSHCDALSEQSSDLVCEGCAALRTLRPDEHLAVDDRTGLCELVEAEHEDFRCGMGGAHSWF